MHQIRKIGIVGTGVMGTGIARVMAQAGYEVTIVKWTEGSVETARGTFEQSFTKAVEQGKLDAGEAKRIFARIIWSEAHHHDLGRCDLVIEAIVEDEAEKLKCLAAVSPTLKQAAILASTTSSLSITALAKATGRPQVFLGLHFFNPPTAMKLVEVVVTESVDPRCVLWMRSFLKEIGKEPVEVPDTPGFRVNRLLVAQFLEAIRMAFDEPSRGDIVGVDACMRFGANHKLGPFELMDFIGLDVVLAMAENLQEGLRQQHFAPPALLEDMVAMGWLGRKSDRGFYDYADKKNLRPNPDLVSLASMR